MDKSLPNSSENLTKPNEKEIPEIKEVTPKGTIPDNIGKIHNYNILHGFNIKLNLKHQKRIGDFYFDLSNKIEVCGSEQEKEKIFSSLSLEDHHWNWILKGIHFNKPGYEWFYLLTDDVVQAIAVIKFPESGILEKGEIFYIDYIASSPWNRNSLIHKRTFKGLGKILIKYALHHAQKILSLRLGCSLHSLPKAESFYSSIGMDRLSEAHAKNGLSGFEFRKKKAKDFMEQE